MSTPTHQTARIPLTASQVLNLGTTPVQIIAGSPGQILIVYNAYLRLFAGTIPFNPASGDAFGFYTGNLTNTFAIDYPAGLPAEGFADQTVDMSQWHNGWLAGFGPTDATADIIGSGLSLAVGNGSWPTGSAWTQGNGTMLALVEYSYVTP